MSTRSRHGMGETKDWDWESKWEHQQNVGTLMILCKKFVRKAVLITSRRYGGKMGSIASDPKNQQRICANGEPADHCPGVPFIGQRHCASRSSRGRQGQQGFVSTSRMWWRTQIMLRRRASRCVYIFILYTLINMSYDMSACILFSLSLFHALDLAPKP